MVDNVTGIRDVMFMDFLGRRSRGTLNVFQNWKYL